MELLIKESVNFLWLSVKAFYEKGKNFRDLPGLNQEAWGYVTVPFKPTPSSTAKTQPHEQSKAHTCLCARVTANLS